MEPSEWISYLDFSFQQVKLQQEVRDRWFRYYLTIAGAVLGTGIATAKLFYKGQFEQRLCLFLMALCLGMGFIGICFFMIYLRQRANYIQQYKTIQHIEKALFGAISCSQHHALISGHHQPDWKDLFFIIRSHSIKKYGADYFTVWVHIIVSSIYFSSAFVFYVLLVNETTVLSSWQIFMSVLIFCLSALWLEIVRNRNFYS